jgi:hypothetical protein
MNLAKQQAEQKKETNNAEDLAAIQQHCPINVEAVPSD